MKKRIFSILLCLCMVLMLFPVTALADDATALQNLLDNATSGGTVKLDKDYTVDTTLQVGDHVILDLNGHVIKMTGNGSVIKVSNVGELTLTDSRPTATHTGDYASLPAGGVITGGNISARHTDGDGGGVYVGGGSFTMEDGTIYDCTCYNGGVFVSESSFNMTGGTISGCTTDGIGCSCVYVGNGSFTISGGTIDAGNAVSANDKSTINANGGTIYGTVESWGLILNNATDGGCTEFYGKVMNCKNGAISTSGTISGGIYYGGIQDYGGNISGKTVTFMKDGRQYALEVVATDSKVAAPTEPKAPEGMTFAGWYADKALTNLYNFSNAVTENITLYAGFVPAPYTVTYEFEHGTLPAGRQTPETIERNTAVILPDLEDCGAFKLQGWQIKNSDDTYIYPVDDEYYPSKSMTFVAVYKESDDEIVTLTAPFTTTVKLGGSAAPGETTFELALIDKLGNELTYGDQYFGAVVTTDGAGDYDGTLTITAPLSRLEDMLSEGAFIWQYDDEEPNWTYDDTVWGLLPSTVAMTLTDDAAPEYTVLIYPTYIKDDGSFAPDLNADQVDRMSFINTYTYSYSAPVRDTATIIIGGEKEESKPVEENPNTGAPVAANMSTLSVLVLAASAVAVLKTRKR